MSDEFPALETAVPGSAPSIWEPGTEGLYADIGRILDGGDLGTPEPDYGTCNDGIALFYAGQVNVVMGDPEGGKTLLAQAAAVQCLRDGLRVAMIDCDHNGDVATVARLAALGAAPETLRNLERFRYCDPDDADHIAAVVRDLREWEPHLVIVDSIGELLPMFGANSNSADEYTSVNRAVLVPLARVGAAVVGIDHLAKNTESRKMGATGTAAKKRAVGGAALRVTTAETFTPGKGGAAHVTIVKDRHGGLRAHRPTGDREPLAATFRIYPDGHPSRFSLIAPDAGDRNPTENAPQEDVDALKALDPMPTTVEEARQRLQWRKTRAAIAMRTLRASQNDGSPVPTYRGGNREPQGSTVPGTGQEPGTDLFSTLCDVCQEPMSEAASARGSQHAGCEVAS